MSNRSGLSKVSSQAVIKTKPKYPSKQSPSGRKEGSSGLSASQPIIVTADAHSEGDARGNSGEAIDLETQVKARDATIEDLRRRIIQLLTQVKRMDLDSAAAKEKQLKQLLEDKSALLKQAKTAEQAITDLQEQLQAATQKQESEKQAQELVVEALTEEMEKLKTRLGEKLEQQASAKTDVSQMSKIVQDMTHLNTELNEKILKMNQDMEENNKTVFEATAKASQTENLEKELIEEKTKVQQLEEDMNQAKENLEKSDAMLKNALSIAGAVCEDLKTVESEECKKAVEALKAIPTFLPAPKAAAFQDSLSSLSFKVQQLKAELKDEKKESARVSKIDSLQRARITALESEKNKIKGELGYVIEKQKKQLAVLKEWMKTAVEKSHNMEEKMESTLVDYQKSQMALMNMTEKATQLKALVEGGKKVEDSLKQTVKTLRMSLLDAQSDRTAFESSLLTRESKAKEVISRVDALTEELWKRDNEIIRKEAQRLKLQEDLNNLKAALQSSYAQFKTRMSEEISKTNVKLEGREQEINELKRMLAQGQTPTAAKKVKSNHQTLVRLEDAQKQLKILKDRTKSGTGEESDRQLIDTLKGRCNAIVTALEKELQATLEMPLSAEQAAGFSNIREMIASKEGATMTVQEVLADMKNYINQA